MRTFFAPEASSISPALTAMSRIIVFSFSPGFFVGNQRRGRPLFFVSHGKRDQILPFDTTSRRIVPELEAANYDVRFKEFDGPHTLPAPIAREAFEWIAGKKK